MYLEAWWYKVTGRACEPEARCSNVYSDNGGTYSTIDKVEQNKVSK